jgi:hypothetical protein
MERAGADGAVKKSVKKKGKLDAEASDVGEIVMRVHEGEGLRFSGGDHGQQAAFAQFDPSSLSTQLRTTQ